MMDATNKQPQEVTILRIKRKRNEEPLDALVVESRRKKSKGGLNALGDGMNVFQFAETVEPDTWDDEKQKQDLETRLSTLARESSHKKLQTPSPLPESRPEPVPEGDKPGSANSTRPPTPPLPTPAPAPASSTPAKTPAQDEGEPKPKPKSSPCPPPNIDDPARKYTIVASQSVGSPDEWPSKKANSRLKAPPKVHSYKDLLKAAVTMYDAIPASGSLSSLPSSEPSMDPEVAKFLPMLKDYLNISGDSSALTSSSSGITADDDDYVWDVFYSRPATFKDLYYGAGGKVNIGTVTGLPDDGYGSSDESDMEDEDDEDSNAEDWYKNDYPDEEDQRSDGSDGSDIFHEDSDYEDAGPERGRWSLDPDN